MKRRTIIAALVLAICTGAAAIKPKVVKWSFNLKTINAEMGDKRTQWTLNDDFCGWCYVRKPGLGHNGLLIYKAAYTQDIIIYDLKCPVCDKAGINSSIEMDESVTATCRSCGTSYNITTTGYPVNSMDTEAVLESYHYTRNGDIIHIDNTPGFNQRMRLWKMRNN